MADIYKLYQDSRLKYWQIILIKTMNTTSTHEVQFWKCRSPILMLLSTSISPPTTGPGRACWGLCGGCERQPGRACSARRAAGPPVSCGEPQRTVWCALPWMIWAPTLNAFLKSTRSKEGHLSANYPLPFLYSYFSFKPDTTITVCVCVCVCVCVWGGGINIEQIYIV